MTSSASLAVAPRSSPSRTRSMPSKRDTPSSHSRDNRECTASFPMHTPCSFAPISAPHSHAGRERITACVLRLCGISMYWHLSTLPSPYSPRANRTTCAAVTSTITHVGAGSHPLSARARALVHVPSLGATARRRTSCTSVFGRSLFLPKTWPALSRCVSVFAARLRESSKIPTPAFVPVPLVFARPGALKRAARGCGRGHARDRTRYRGVARVAHDSKRVATQRRRLLEVHFRKCQVVVCDFGMQRAIEFSAEKGRKVNFSRSPPGCLTVTGGQKQNHDAI